MTNYIKLYRSSRYLLSCILCSLCTTVVMAQTAPVQNRTTANSDTSRRQTEDEIFRLRTVPIPQGLLLEVGGMAFLPNDALAVATRRGEVWIISNPYMKNNQAPKYQLFAQGMHEVLGMNYVNGELYVTQRSELTRLKDLDGDGKADSYETVYSWPLSGNYHEYSYGPMLDRDGNMILALNLGWTGKEVSLSKWHGWFLKLTPDGKMEPFATGFRSPAGMTLNNDGEIFYVENQGGWVGSGYLAHVEKGDFMGHVEGLRWADQPGSPVKLKISDIPNTGEPKFDVAKRVPGLKTPAVWMPHAIFGISTSGVLNYDTKGNMGPFEGQLFVGDQGQSKIMRIALEKVKGVYQGAAFLFRAGFSSGILRMNWGSDGSMFVGMTSRGWGSTGTSPFGLQRLEWSGVTPFEIKTIKAQPDGFELEFTAPVNEASARNVGSYAMRSFTYKYHSTYGSPAINASNRQIKAIVVSPDRMRVRLVVDSLKEGYIHEIKAEGVQSTDKLLVMHNVGYYTLNRIPDGEKVVITSANMVTTADHNMAAMSTAAGATTPLRAAASGKHVTTQPADWTTGADRTIVLGVRPGLKYDVEAITVKAGSKIKLTFNNNDDMQHNVVITEPGMATLVGEMALKLGIDGERLNFVPTTPNVVVHTFLLQPGKSDSIYFLAPDKPGEYQYLCTYPGHFMVMRGTLKVEK